MRLVERWHIALAFGVMTLVMWLADTGWWAFAPLAIGIYLFKRVGPRLDPERFFDSADRDIIYNRAGGRCEWPGCGVLTHYETNCPLGGCDDCYQADHVVPWSKGGVTGLTNGACLCAFHNRLKSNH